MQDPRVDKYHSDQISFFKIKIYNLTLSRDSLFCANILVKVTTRRKKKNLKVKCKENRWKLNFFSLFFVATSLRVIELRVLFHGYLRDLRLT